MIGGINPSATHTANTAVVERGNALGVPAESEM